MSVHVLVDVGLVLFIVGIGLATWAIRRRPRRWRRMTWKAVAATPGTHEGVAVTGLALVVVGVVVISVARVMS